MKREIIYTYGECQRSVRRTLRRLIERFPEENLNYRNVYKVCNLFEDTGSVRQPQRVRNHPTTRNPDTITAVMQAIEENPCTSTRIISRQNNVSQTAVVKILKQLKFHPFKINLNQELHGQDYENRVVFCNEMLARINQDQNFNSNILFTDESSFKSNGVVNRHNMHYWAVENPNWVREVDNQRLWSLNVWGGIIGNTVIGPHFFNGHLDGIMYQNFLEMDLPPLLENVPLNVRRRLMLMQDGAPPHWSLRVRQYLNEHYNPWIGRGGQIAWPARSPDLTPCDFFYGAT